MLNYLYVCNTSSDCISKVNLNSFSEENRIFLNSNSMNGRVGPHGICANNDKLIIANNYSDSMSILNMSKEIEENSYYIGVQCNDVVVFENNAYIICGDLNSLVVFDLSK